MEISEDRLLDLAERDMRMYDSRFGYKNEIEKVEYKTYEIGLIAIDVSRKDGSVATLCSGNDLDEIVRSYLVDLKMVWGTESLEEFEMLLESKGF